jgi:nitrate/nitrite transporter NarK
MVISRFGPRKSALASVLVAALSLLCSSFLTKSVVGLILVHGIVLGSANALGFIVSFRMS